MSEQRGSDRIIASYHDLNPDSRDEWVSIYRPCWKKLLATDAETMGEALDLVSEREQTLLLVGLLIHDVDNGGIDQWLYNEPGDRAQETLEALKRIGSTKTYDLLAKAISLFPPEALPRDRQKRMKVMVEFEEKHPRVEEELFRLSMQFYETGENIIDLAIAYWRSTEPRYPPESVGGDPDQPADGERKKTTP
ncbi:MAG: DMP19 family protein [Planctomycetes bacterium]|nr:DMP19 family protein [Planctomycetota bacterium]